MAEDFFKITGSKEEQYQGLIPSIKGIIEGEDDLIANLANVAAMLHTQFEWFWTGFYLVKEEQLVLAPFQGPIACTRISYNKGVCGQAWAQKKSIVVPDVALFPGHIACSSASKSEIVIPILRNDICLGVLDIDSDQLNAFDAIDQKYLEEIVAAIPC